MGINPVDSSIPLAGVNPVTTLKDLATVDNLRSEIDQRQQQSSRIPLQNQQTQLANDNAQLVNDQMKLDMSDAQKVKEFLSDPTNARAVGAGQFDTLYKLGVQPKIVQGLQKYSLESRETQAKLEHSDLENSQTRNSAVGKFLTSLNDEKDPARRQQAWQTGLSNLRTNGLLKGVDLPQEFNGSQDQMNNLLVEHGFLSGVTDSALKRKKEAAETAQNEAKATSELATAAENTLKSKQMARQQVASQLASVAETNPAGLAAAVAALPPEHQGLFSGVTNPKAIRRLAMTPEQAVQADREEADLERRRMSDAETQRYHTGELAARSSEVGISAGRLGVERLREGREQQIYQQTYGEGANPALVGVEPKLRGPATSAALKADVEHQTAIKSADDLQTLINLSRKGNKAAGANIPLVGTEAVNALAGIKRINRVEVEQYGSAGNLLDKIKGRIGGLVEGQPIPSDVMKDIEAMHGELRGNADRVFQSRLQGIDSTYRSNFQSTTGRQAKPDAPRPQQGVIRARDPQGKLHEAPAGTALPAGWKEEK